MLEGKEEYILTHTHTDMQPGKFSLWKQYGGVEKSNHKNCFFIVGSSNTNISARVELIEKVHPWLFFQSLGSFIMSIMSEK